MECPSTSSVLDEICSHGSTGLSLSSLWPKLSVSCPYLKASIWKNLLSLPCLQFKVRNTPQSPTEPSIQCLEAAQKLNLKIVATQSFRDSFLGLYGTESDNASLSAVQRRVLERIAMTRATGIAQNQIGKEFGIQGNNLFYIVRILECRGLIVRQPAIVRTREFCSEGGSKDSSSVTTTTTTNMVYLSRYAKPLGSHQRFENNKEVCSMESTEKKSESLADGESFSTGVVREDLLVNDYLPAMLAVCNKLDEANGKVLVISDIKQDLGYVGPSGHKSWRNICRRLKEACIVEEFAAIVDEKVEICLRLLKRITEKDFETIGSGCHFDKEKQLSFGRRIKKTDELAELSLDRQIYDMVDAAGAEGLALMEVCDRLGLDKKRNYSRLCNMVSRFGMHLQAENHKKTTVFRVWTAENFSLKPSDAFHDKLENVNIENKISNVDGTPVKTFVEDGLSMSDDDFATPSKFSETTLSISHKSPEDCTTNDIYVFPDHPQQTFPMTSEVKTRPEARSPTSDNSLALAKNSDSIVFKAYPLTADNAKREQRVLERLQDEKFILRADLFRGLLSFEKDKGTTMDRRTMDRIVAKLEQQERCKRTVINVPNATNCGRRSTQVILHPSVRSITPSLVSDIHDKLRMFEVETRGNCSSRWKSNEPVTILNDIHRSQNYMDLDSRACKSEAMRANGFVMAKMVRTKLLHGFLWDSVRSSPSWSDALCFSNDLRSCSLFSLEATLQTIPVELFLQIVGSSQKFDDMIEKCKKGLRLSDLPAEEYKLLMDSLASNRLSGLIDILRRLELIRLVSTDNFSDGLVGKSTNLKYALELKPYIEEPVSLAATLSLTSLDLRPQIRHDFALSNRKAVDEYWLTLEYCYSTADSRAAIRAFPGSRVHEVFIYRSWASARVMTADQRSKLLKYVTKDNPSEKLSFKQCEKAAKDLNLTIEQVLRLYYDKHRRPNRYRGILNANKEDQLIERKLSSSTRKRKRSRIAGSVNVTGVIAESKQLGSGCVDQTDQPLLLESSEKHDTEMLPVPQESDNPESAVNLGLNEDECYSVFEQSSISKSTRQKRFCWTEETDRQLLIQYLKYRAALGSNFDRVIWAALPDLPAAPATCRRKMASLRRDKKFREAMMRLCNLLSERYARHLKKKQKRLLTTDDGTMLARSYCRNALTGNEHSCVEHVDETGPGEARWDNFNEKTLKQAFDDLLHLKQMAKLGASTRVRPVAKEWSSVNTKAGENGSARRSRSRRLHQKFIKVLNEEVGISRQVQESLAVSSAVELLKLVFLSRSTAKERPTFMAETLRRYSQRDLFAAYSYLRDKKILVGGSSSQHIELSQHFIHNISKSPFPVSTGKRAAKFSSWLLERERDYMPKEINLTADLQCGDVFNLFALVSSGELSMSLSLPDDGVGEAEDLRGSKRRSEDFEACDGDKNKKLKFSIESEFSRREKGFPGITISVRRESLSTADIIELFKGDKPCTTKAHQSDEFGSNLGEKIESNACKSDNMTELNNKSSIISTTGKSDESQWKTMAHYAECLISRSFEDAISPVGPEVFKSVFTAIQKAGDQGLSAEDINLLEEIPEGMSVYIIDVLGAFGRAFKVDGYDSVHVVDALYRSKYLLTFQHFSSEKSSVISTESLRLSNSSCKLPTEADITCTDSHKVTILNRPEEACSPLKKAQRSGALESSVQCVVPERGNYDDTSLSGELCVPILPWMNADGTINKIVFSGLVRRVLGNVMQNPAILEDEIIRKMDVLKPQSCRKLLELMVLDGHLRVREMQQTIYNGPPALLGGSKPELIYRKHFFANPMSSSYL